MSPRSRACRRSTILYLLRRHRHIAYSYDREGSETGVPVSEAVSLQHDQKRQCAQRLHRVLAWAIPVLVEFLVGALVSNARGLLPRVGRGCRRRLAWAGCRTASLRGSEPLGADVPRLESDGAQRCAHGGGSEGKHCD